MRSISIDRTIALGAICCLFLFGCTRPPAQVTPRSVDTATPVPSTPRPAETLTLTPLATAPSPSVSPTPQPTDTPAVALVSIGDVVGNPEAFRDRLVHMRGYGLIVATFPLCQGYVGLDRRTNFVDATGAKMVADVKWQPAPGTRMYDPDNLRTFEGYIRIFNGEIGCPGEAKVETFPYFEVVGVVE
ncbi:MAG: hypothetical protein ACP5R2_06455 [Anaerolineae bacterium]